MDRNQEWIMNQEAYSRIFRQYNKDKFIVFERYYIDSKKEYTTIIYHKRSTAKCSEKTFLNRKPHGQYTSWYKNGKVLSEGMYMFGSRAGVWKTYYKQGQLKTMTTYDSDERYRSVYTYNHIGNVIDTVVHDTRVHHTEPLKKKLRSF